MSRRLSVDDIKQIWYRALYETNGEIARDLGLHRTTVSKILQRKSHLHVEISQAHQRVVKELMDRNMHDKKLSPDDVRLVFELSLTMSAEDVAEKFDVDQSTITNVLLRKSWRHVHIDPDLLDRVDQAKQYRMTMGRWGK